MQHWPSPWPRAEAPAIPAAVAAGTALSTRRLTGVVNPSTKAGGTLRIGNAGDWDNVDPADTYYGFSWDFIHLYGRALTMFKPVPGTDGQTAGPRPGREPRRAQRRLQDLDLQAQAGHQVRGRHAGRAQGRQVRRRAHAGQEHVPERPDVLQRLPRHQGLHPALQGQDPGPPGSEGRRDAGRQHDHLPSEEAVRGLRLLRDAAGHHPGAAREGHRCELQAARGLDRPVQVRELHARASR